MAKKPTTPETETDEAIEQQSTVAAPVTPADMETAQQEAGPDPVNPMIEPKRPVYNPVAANQPYPTGNPPPTPPKVAQNELPPFEEE